MSQIPTIIRKQRAAKLRALGDELHDALLQKMVGQTLPVLIESDGMGWTDNYLRVILSKKYPIGQIVAIKIKKVKNHALVG